MATKQSVLKQIETVMSKMVNLNSNIEGNQLQAAMRDLARTRDCIENGRIKIKKS